MKKVVLLGDSIRLLGYGNLVPGLLGENFEVWQPEENCRFTTNTLRMLFDLRPCLEGADVIHWNNGLWDTCDLFGDGAFTPLDVYASNLKRMATILLGICPRVIFATTTVTHPDCGGQNNARIAAYNEAAVAALRPMGIRINDLCSTVAEHRDAYICEDLIHLSPVGAEALARQVTEAVLDALGKMPG